MASKANTIGGVGIAVDIVTRNRNGEWRQSLTRLAKKIQGDLNPDRAEAAAAYGAAKELQKIGNQNNLEIW